MIFKQFAVGIGIAVLLPLFVFYGASVISPPPDSSKLYSQSQDYQSKEAKAKSSTEKKKISDTKSRLEKEYNAADRRHQQMVFYVAYPLGILAIIFGAFVAAPAVGAGLMFGGIFTLTTGCGVYWDKMSDALHFGALAIALLVIVSLGIWKIRPESSQKGKIVS
ncbi:MAG: hypothetical protein ABI210_08175 [Abditibacteriaceae bacterium]